MSLLRKLLGVVAICMLVASIGLSTVQAAGNELVKVTVNITVESPDYFWHYPFSGTPLDRIRVSGLGKTVYVQSLTEGQKIVFDVPKGYKFRVFVDFLNGNNTFKYVYRAKQEISEENNSFNINVKAPESQPIVINVVGFDEVKP